jgi:hypothetical protein
MSSLLSLIKSLFASSKIFNLNFQFNLGFKRHMIAKNFMITYPLIGKFKQSGKSACR